MKWGQPLELADRTAWRAWLLENHTSVIEVFVLITRNASSKAGLKYDEAVEEALCFGWIDGIARRFDVDRGLNRFTPRRPKSKWSDSNRRRIRHLAACGRVEKAGLDAVPADLLSEIVGGLE